MTGMDFGCLGRALGFHFGHRWILFLIHPCVIFGVSVDHLAYELIGCSLPCV